MFEKKVIFLKNDENLAVNTYIWVSQSLSLNEQP